MFVLKKINKKISKYFKMKFGHDLLWIISCWGHTIIVINPFTSSFRLNMFSFLYFIWFIKICYKNPINHPFITSLFLTDNRTVSKGISVNSYSALHLFPSQTRPPPPPPPPLLLSPSLIYGKRNFQFYR